MNVERFDSSNENVSKYVHDYGNAVAESVLYKHPTYDERTVMCISTQSGCPVGCRFCGAGDSFVRSLTATEIVRQVFHMINDRHINLNACKRSQIMFMSMGEPMLNFKQVAIACKQFRSFFPHVALLISTSAPRVEYDELISLAMKIPTIGLQFSVHESTDEARDKLIPFKSKLTLEEIAAFGEWFYEATGRQPFFNYCAHENNTTDQDASRLLHLFCPDIWQATISVVCERNESVAAANERQQALAVKFMNKLSGLGYSTRCFDPAGQDDIGGGCGQLWFVQKWMGDHPGLVRPSIGRGMKVVHAPTIQRQAA